MKLRNKKTGEIGYPYFQNWKEITCVIVDENAIQIAEYTSLAELNAEWEDYEDDDLSKIIDWIDKGLVGEILPISVNDFVEKLKAWKLLKDMGFKIEGIRYRNNKSYIEWTISQKVRDDHFMSEAFNEALHLLFGGEDE